MTPSELQDSAVLAGLLRSDVDAYNARVAEAARIDLRGVDLRGADLARAHLERTDLSGADLSGARADGSQLCRARLESTRLDGVLIDDYWRGILASIQLVWSGAAAWNGARVPGADPIMLDGADFTDARLAGIDFADAFLAGARLTDCSDLATIETGAPFVPLVN